MRRRDVFDSHHVRFLALFLVGLAACFGAFAEPLFRRTFTHEAMGTEFSLTLYSRPEVKGTDEIRGIADEAFAVVDGLENKISVWRLDSQVAYINKHAAREPAKAAPDVIDLIFDPRTGRPVEGMLSVTVIGRSGIETDALSTAFFVMGAEKTRAYCKTHPGLRVTLVPVGEKDNLHPVRVGDWDQPGKEPPP